MRKLVNNVAKNKFIRNVIVVASGTAMAQIITMLFSPVITRMYGPEAFGIQGVIIALINIIAPIAALTYPIAIVLPEKDKEAKNIAKISIFISIFIGIVVTLCLLFFKDSIIKLFNLNEIANYLYLIPLVILFSAILQVTQQWLIRTKQFRITARATIINSIVTNGSKVLLGLLNPMATILVVISAITNAIQSLLLFQGIKKRKMGVTVINEEVSTKTILELIKDYKDFPLYRAPQIFINAMSQSIPTLILTTFFGPASAGFYTIGRTVLNMPTQLIGKSVGDVFYPKVVEIARKGDKITPLVFKTTFFLAAIGIVPFGLVIAFGPALFSLVFGEEWSVAGEYARWLALWTFFSFINRPSVTVIPVLNIQGRFLVYEIVSLILRVIALFIGFKIYNNEVIAVSLFSITGVIVNVFLITYTLIICKNRGNNDHVN